MNSYTWAPGQLINQAQTTFVGLLRVLSIPIVLMLSAASGFTTYYGLSFFITPWIALIITIAVQSIIVICSLEIASIHWRANPLRYLLVSITLLVSVAVSVSFSYFKFYEISEKETIELQRLAAMKQSIGEYLKTILDAKAALIKEQQTVADKAGEEANLAFLGTHPSMKEKHRNKVGHGPFWEQYNKIHQDEVSKVDLLAEKFKVLTRQIGDFRIRLNSLGGRSDISQDEYQTLVSQYTAVQSVFENIMSDAGHAFPAAPLLLPYAEYTQGFKPSFAMWLAFSWFAFACAAMVDLFTIILSYRLEFTAPGPLTEDEQELAYQCLREFKELRINHNDELELVIEKTELERARKYSDWNRSFGAAYLLNRGYLRKIDDRTVEFAPNLYPIIASRLGTSQVDRASVQETPLRDEPPRSLKDTVQRLYHERKR
ncbi:MAG: hypothetical protein L0Y43_00230 [Methylococcaceae bacterium]|nr:hypothetical protein [Methylococcaceae bacterium]